MHHFAFAFGLGSIQLIWHWGPGSNMFMFFVTGFPGGIDYAMLAAVKRGWMSRLDEKRHNSTINAWFRGPGCVLSSGWIFACWSAGNCSQIPTPAIMATVFLAFVNGQYYAQRVIANYAQCRQAERDAKRAKDGSGSASEGRSSMYKSPSMTELAKSALLGPTQSMATTQESGWRPS